MRTVSFMMMLLLLTGCISITDRITPEDRTVKPLTIGRDCFLFLPGLAYGVNTVEKAMANADPLPRKFAVFQSIQAYGSPLDNGA